MQGDLLTLSVSLTETLLKHDSFLSSKTREINSCLAPLYVYPKREQFDKS